MPLCACISSIQNSIYHLFVFHLIFDKNICRTFGTIWEVGHSYDMNLYLVLVVQRLSLINESTKLYCYYGNSRDEFVFCFVLFSSFGHNQSILFLLTCVLDALHKQREDRIKYCWQN